MCTIDILPELIDAGIDSFKIEGRMKQPEYVYTVVKMYRKYADQYLKLQKEGKGQILVSCIRGRQKRVTCNLSETWLL